MSVKKIRFGFVKLPNYPEGLEVKGKKVEDIWKFAHSGDACVDIYAAKGQVINAGDTKIIPTGVKLEIPQGWEVQIRPRSGMSSKGLVAQLGTIDSGYKGEIGVIMHNNSRDNKYIQPGERIAQAAFREAPVIEFIEIKESDMGSSDRGEGGYGSSGK